MLFDNPQPPPDGFGELFGDPTETPQPAPESLVSSGESPHPPPDAFGELFGEAPQPAPLPPVAFGELPPQLLPPLGGDLVGERLLCDPLNLSREFDRDLFLFHLLS